MQRTTETTREHWRQIVRRQEASGLGISAFCRRESVAISSFFAWRSRLRTIGASPAAEPAFVEVTVSGDGARGAGVSICLAGGRRISLGTRNWDAPSI